jgi:hypothetical protein
MKNDQFSAKAIAVLLLLCCYNFLEAQNQRCVFKAPVVTIDFGTESSQQNPRFFPLPSYGFVSSRCPNDGFFSFVSNTSGCFNGDWVTFNEDHTPNDNDGRMMLVNASQTPGPFFSTVVTGLRPNATYEFAVWLTNVCKIIGGCPPLPPRISIRLLTPMGKQVALFNTGQLSQTDQPLWMRYSALFSTPVSTLTLIMEDITLGGCGNDFAMDDITLRECVVPPPAEKVAAKPMKQAPKQSTVPAVKAAPRQAPIVKTTVKTPVEKLQPSKQERPVARIERPSVEIVKAATPGLQQMKASLPAPKPIATRANPLIKQIEIPEGDISIDLYDNGEIDGDTVTVYNNNELIVSEARLSAKPTNFRIKVDAAHPHHEIIMVANNLGSIPPNTSIMIITTKDKRFEVFISSSEQKNAKVVIDLKQ